MKTLQSVWNLVTFAAAVVVMSGLIGQYRPAPAAPATREAVPPSPTRQVVDEAAGPVERPVANVQDIRRVADNIWRTVSNDRPAEKERVAPPVEDVPHEDVFPTSHWPPRLSPEMDDYTVLQYWRTEISACRGSLGVVNVSDLGPLYGNRLPEVIAGAKSGRPPASYTEAPESYARKLRARYAARVERGCINGYCPTPISSRY